MMETYGIWIYIKLSVIQIFMHLTSFFYFNFDKILLFNKVICTQHWSQISGFKVDHQR